MIHAMSNGAAFPIPLFLAGSDVDGADGQGVVTLTNHHRGALTFKDTAAALSHMLTQSAVRPLREDGLANRPLRAFTMQIMDAPK